MTEEFTGERYLPSLDWPEVSYEHWHRYLWVSPLAAGRRVLDAACGEGYGSDFLARAAAHVTGVDVSEAVIEKARRKYQRANLSYVCGSVASLPIEGAQLFDLAVSFETIEHVGEKEQLAFLAEVKRLLKSDGRLVISTPNKATYTDIPKAHNEYHIREFYQDEFASFLGRFFRNVRLLSQRVYPVSYIWPMGGGHQSFAEYQLDFLKDRFEPVSDDRKEVLYILAVCSDGDIGEFGKSLLVDVADQALLQKTSRVVELNSRVAELEQRAKRLDQEVQELRFQLLERDKLVRTRNEPLSAISRGNGWRFLQWLWRIRR